MSEAREVVSATEMCEKSNLYSDEQVAMKPVQTSGRRQAT
jgi:hypothetical protein